MFNKLKDCLQVVRKSGHSVSVLSRSKDIMQKLGVKTLQHLSEVTCPKGFIPVYLLCSSLTRRERQGDFSEFFSHLHDHQIETNHIFLTEEAAAEHGRFLTDEHTIIQAIVPESAVVGRSNYLALRKGTLKDQYVHGCWTRRNYLTNPVFRTAMA